MKSQAKNHLVISRDILTDILILKRSINQNCLELDQNDNMTGFIQDIHADPFGFLTMSQLQVNNPNLFQNF